MPDIDIIIIGILVGLAAIVGIRFFLRRRVAARTEASVRASDADNSTLSEQEQPHTWPKAFDPPKQPVPPAGEPGEQQQETIPPVSAAEAEPEPAPESSSQPSDQPDVKTPTREFADSGFQATPFEDTAGIPTRANVQFAPARVASPEELVAIMGNFTSPLSERFEAIRRAAELSLKEAVPTLVEVLYEPDLGLSAAAAEALGKIGDPRGIEPLLEITHRNDIRLMQDIKAAGVMPDSDGREAEGISDKSESKMTAMEVIPEVNPFKYRELTVFKIDLLPKEYFQPDGSPIPRRDLVMKGLKDNDQQLRKMAAKAAIGINDPDVIPTLVETLQNPYEVESVRYLAAEALGDSGDERGGEPLLKALTDENVAVRYSAATALSKMRGEQTVVALIAALSDENEFVRSSVAYALGTIGDHRVIEALLGRVDDKSEVVRFSVGKALGGFAGDEVLDELGKRLDTAGLEMKRALVDVLSQMKNDKAIGLLRKALRNPDPETSFKASMALMNIGDVELLDDLIEASRKLDQELMSWLQEHGKGGRKPKTTSSPGNGPSSKKTEDASKQFDSLYSGGGGGDSIEKLEAALKHESPNVRGCAANALSDFADEKAGKLLLAALDDRHEYVRSSAVAALGKRHDASAVPHLLKLTKDSSEEVRYSLAKALISFGQVPEIIFALHKMAESESSRDVRRAAKMSLEKLKKESEEDKPHE